MSEDKDYRFVIGQRVTYGWRDHESGGTIARVYVRLDPEGTSNEYVDINDDNGGTTTVASSMLYASAKARASALAQKVAREKAEQAASEEAKRAALAALASSPGPARGPV